MIGRIIKRDNIKSDDYEVVDTIIKGGNTNYLVRNVETGLSFVMDPDNIYSINNKESDYKKIPEVRGLAKKEESSVATEALSDWAENKIFESDCKYQIALKSGKMFHTVKKSELLDTLIHTNIQPSDSKRGKKTEWYIIEIPIDKPLELFRSPIKTHKWDWKEYCWIKIV